MNPRSKKYYETKSADDGDKKGSVNKEGYNEQNQKNIKQQPKENPAPSREQDKPNSDSNTATQDDTGGGNDSGKRSDEN
jgi:hypothetical protein